MAESLRYVWLLRTFHVKHARIGGLATSMATTHDDDIESRVLHSKFLHAPSFYSTAGGASISQATPPILACFT